MRRRHKNTQAAGGEAGSVTVKSGILSQFQTNSAMFVALCAASSTCECGGGKLPLSSRNFGPIFGFDYCLGGEALRLFSFMMVRVVLASVVDCNPIKFAHRAIFIVCVATQAACPKLPTAGMTKNKFHEQFIKLRLCSSFRKLEETPDFKFNLWCIANGIKIDEVDKVAENCEI
jgi:hypothetical protein